jgi:hypothetical protein|tara:strand:+ start:986 stop:1168 length:183 start_codon:yes stop_codon:yes gene_type:complete
LNIKPQQKPRKALAREKEVIISFNEYKTPSKCLKKTFAGEKRCLDDCNILMVLKSTVRGK